jgi:hypothetical protein
MDSVLLDSGNSLSGFYSLTGWIIAHSGMAVTCRIYLQLHDHNNDLLQCPRSDYIGKNQI